MKITYEAREPVKREIPTFSPKKKIWVYNKGGRDFCPSTGKINKEVGKMLVSTSKKIVITREEMIKILSDIGLIEDVDEYTEPCLSATSNDITIMLTGKEETV
jgi:hypothetical protein